MRQFIALLAVLALAAPLASEARGATLTPAPAAAAELAPQLNLDGFLPSTKSDFALGLAYRASPAAPFSLRIGVARTSEHGTAAALALKYHF